MSTENRTDMRQVNARYAWKTLDPLLDPFPLISSLPPNHEGSPC